MFEKMTEVEIDKAVAALGQERRSLLASVSKAATELKRLDEEIKNKTREYEHLVGLWRRQKNARVVRIDAYKETRDRINALVDEAATKQEQETKYAHEQRQQRARIQEIDRILAVAEARRAETCQIIPFRFPRGPSSA